MKCPKITLVSENKTCVIDGVKDLEYSFQQAPHDENVYACFIDITITEVSNELSNFLNVTVVSNEFLKAKKSIKNYFEFHFECYIEPVNDFYYLKTDGNTMIRSLAKKNKATKIGSNWYSSPFLEYKSNSNYKKLRLINYN